MLNKADYNSSSDLFSDYLKIIGHLNLTLIIFCRHTNVLNISKTDYLLGYIEKQSMHTVNPVLKAATQETKQ